TRVGVPLEGDPKEVGAQLKLTVAAIGVGGRVSGGAGERAAPESQRHQKARESIARHRQFPHSALPGKPCSKLTELALPAPYEPDHGLGARLAQNPDDAPWRWCRLLWVSGCPVARGSVLLKCHIGLGPKDFDAGMFRELETLGHETPFEAKWGRASSACADRHWSGVGGSDSRFLAELRLASRHAANYPGRRSADRHRLEAR